MTGFPDGRPIRCLSVGHITHDRYGDTLAAGGSVLYAARTMQQLGGETAIATAFGDDFAFYREVAGIALLVAKSPSTTVFENTYPEGAPRLMLVEHPAAPVRPAIVPLDWRTPDVLFLAPVIGEITLDDWLTDDLTARVVGVGLQGFLKQPGAVHSDGPGRTLAQQPFSPSPHLLRRISAIFMSEEDLDGFADPMLLVTLRRQVPLVIVTAGAAGATLYLGDRTVTVGVRAANAVDPTGAGDTFAAACLFALANGAAPIAAARLGAAAASIAVEAIGPAALTDVAKAPGLVDEIPVNDAPAR